MSLQVNDQNFEAEVLQFSGPVLVDFYAEWCGPCKMQGPIIDELAKDLEGSEFKVAKLNVDEANATAGKYNIMSIPTLIIFKNGEPAETLMGLQSKESLKEKLESHK